MSNLNKDHAEKIIKKLGGKLRKTPGKKNRPHDLFEVREAGVVLRLLSLRRGSRRDLGHDHLPGDLGVSAREARELAICTMSRQEWIDKVTGKS